MVSVHTGGAMFMCVQVLLPVFMHLCGGQRSISSVFFDYTLPYFLKHILNVLLYVCVYMHTYMFIQFSLFFRLRCFKLAFKVFDIMALLNNVCYSDSSLSLYPLLPWVPWVSSLSTSLYLSHVSHVLPHHCKV